MNIRNAKQYRDAVRWLERHPDRNPPGVIRSRRLAALRAAFASECPACEGTGHSWGLWGPCWRCGGSGKEGDPGDPFVVHEHRTFVVYDVHEHRSK